jgi:ubiquinone/menaquinone biosynthesis C-methylase UbiE
MIDKDIERGRYDKRAKKLLKTDSFNISDKIFLPLKAPYVSYQNQIKGLRAQNLCRVLEIGAGMGENTEFLLESDFNVCATDISSISVKVMKKRFSKYGNFSSEVADMENLPFDNELFDLVCSAGSLSYGDNTKVMNEIHRVIKPGGVFICVDSLNENPIYIVNRWLGYVRGKRTLSTIGRMPTLKLIEEYQKNFEPVRLNFFGSLIWMSPLLRLIIGTSNTAIFIDKFDNAINVRRSAFKFVMMLRRK